MVASNKDNPDQILSAFVRETAVARFPGDVICPLAENEGIIRLL